MNCTLRVTTADPDVARISIRRHQFVIGRPIELDEASPRISAMEYAVGAIAGEVVNGLRVFASRHRVDLDRVEAVATGELQHGLTYLEVVGESGQPRIARVHLKVFVATPDESGRAAPLGRAAGQASALLHDAIGLSDRSRIDCDPMTRSAHVPTRQ